MHQYITIFLSTLFGLLVSLSLFNLVVDPYAAVNWTAIEGLNARKSRAHEDGRRVLVSHQLLKRPEKSIIIGSSRVVDGFPEAVTDWPGGLYNAGLRGSNAYELAHVAALAQQKDGLRCVIVGMDVSEFSGGKKFKSAFLISRFPDGIRWRSLARMMLSPNTLMRSVQTVRDNLTGKSDKPPFRDIYEAGEQRKRFIRSVNSITDGHQNLKMSPERIDYLFTALDSLAANGVQVIGYIHPLHAWYEEPSFRAGQDESSLELRRILTHRFETLAKDYQPTAPCTPEGDAVLWDFSGFQWPATSPLPTEAQTQTHEIFHEPAHYLSWLGKIMTDRMLGTPNHPSFGFKLTPENVDSTEVQIEMRRRAYLEQNAEGLLLEQALRSHQSQPPAIVSNDLTDADWEQLKALIK